VPGGLAACLDKPIDGAVFALQALTAEALAARQTAMEVAARLQMEGASRPPVQPAVPSIPIPALNPVIAAALEAAKVTASNIHKQV
jgi:hypothetical protein